MPSPVRALLFEPMDSPRLHEMSMAARPFINDAVLRHWMPFENFDVQNSRFTLYNAIVIRVNVLEHYCAMARSHQTMGTPDTELDAFSFYLHAWLDAHILAAIAISSAAGPLSDDSECMQQIMTAYAPRPTTIFHEGELPYLVDAIESCSFFSDTSKAGEDTLTSLFNKTIPRRCGVRNVIPSLDSLCTSDPSILYCLASMIAASLLGIYRHARRRPALAERMRIYRTFFFDPQPPLRELLDTQRVMCGKRQHLTDQEWRLLFAHIPSSDDQNVIYNDSIGDGSFAQRRQVFVQAFITAHVITVKETGTTVTNQQHFVHQDTVVNMMREYLVYVLDRFLPHVADELRERTEWESWQTSVVACMDTMRAANPSPKTILRTVLSSAVPDKTLYQVELVPFVDALVADSMTFLDSGVSRDTADGSELPLDAMMTHEMITLVRYLVGRYPRIPLMPVLTVPATMEEFEREYVPKGHFPLMLFYASSVVVREYCAAYTLYTRTSSANETMAFVRFLADTCGMYQMMLVYTFAQAQYDRMHIYTIPLAKHIVDKQAASMRGRLNMSPERPLPLHMLSTFVCMNCRLFRGALVSGKQDNGANLPMFGSRDVAFQTTCIESVVARRLREHGFPTIERLQTEARESGGTLFEWYRRHATIDMSSSTIPADPLLFDAPPNAIVEAAAWIEKVDRPITFEVPRIPLTNYITPSGEPNPVPPPLATALTSFSEHEEFLNRWEKLNQRPFISGHRSTTEESVIWTCAWKRYKAEERKTRQTGAAMQKVANAITAQERVKTLRSANASRRHDMRRYHTFSLCNRSRVHAVSMLGHALCLDDTLYVACVNCLGYTKMSVAHWRGDSLLCTPCHRLGTTTTTPFGTMTTVKCRKCRLVRKSGVEFPRVSAYDEISNEFVDVFLCPTHAKKKTWLLSSPIIHPLATIDVGLRSNWGSLRAWDSSRDYTIPLFGPEQSGASKKATMRYARRLLGDNALFGDGDDEADGDNDDEASEAEPVMQRRRVSADSRMSLVEQ